MDVAGGYGMNAVRCFKLLSFSFCSSFLCVYYNWANLGLHVTDSIIIIIIIIIMYAFSVLLAYNLPPFDRKTCRQEVRVRFDIRRRDASCRGLFTRQEMLRRPHTQQRTKDHHRCFIGQVHPRRRFFLYRQH